jgi:5'-3' exonuclease
MSSDGDWWQFCTPCVDIIIKKNEIITYDEVCHSLGYPPERYNLFNAICGSHNGIPGLYRFPKATAVDLCNRFDNIDSMMHHLAVAQPRLAEKMEKLRWQFDRNMKVLNYGRTHFNPDWMEVTQHKVDKAGLKKVFEKWAMKSLIEEMQLG